MLFFVILPRPPKSSLFPYTTLFRSPCRPSHRCRRPPILRESPSPRRRFPDRKSTGLNSSHQIISYAVFRLKKRKRSELVAVLLMVDGGDCYMLVDLQDIHNSLVRRD